MPSVPTIELGWIDHPDAKLSTAGPVRVPDLSVRLAIHEAHVFYRADLAPSAALTVLPTEAAYRVKELIIADLQVAYDPVLRLSVRVWKGRQKLRVFGSSLSDHLELRLPLAFDATEKLGTAVLGQHFFHAVRMQLDGQGLGSATLLPE